MRILVVEDEKDLNHLIVKKMESEGYCVDSCYDGETAYDYLCLAEYDGAIFDVMLPGISGFELLRKVRAKGIAVSVLFLTARDDTDDIVQGLDMGADDYMVKPFSFKELLSRVRVMMRKKVDSYENVYRCGELYVDVNQHRVFRREKEIELSPREYAILLYLIRNQGIVVSREQIKTNIWNFDDDGCSNIIDVYIRYLRKKIDADYEFKMIQTIRGVG